ncbi:hypothetical protein B296_00008068 [Ensete ventricosum]|uniref:Uncharacterized protein n=1 Tax=Ensete ventricosum TaxID=4639 RepID=A0A426XUK9_ENSVE|nr:hypothetical protein B296_00008068 [Ensete ventricosum]
MPLLLLMSFCTLVFVLMRYATFIANAIVLCSEPAMLLPAPLTSLRRGLGPQCDPQFYKAQRNRETTSLRFEFPIDRAGGVEKLDLQFFFHSKVCWEVISSLYVLSYD